MAAFGRVAALIDPMIRAVPDFEHQLAAPLRHALAYCEGLVAGLPGPIAVGRHAFGTDALVHALFATADDVDQMLGKSQLVRDYLAQPACLESESFYAMLAARRQQKRQLGLALSGEVVQSEVPQTVLYFSGHMLMEPCCSLDQTLTRLRAVALDSLLSAFQEHVSRLRRERDGLRADLSVERAQIAAMQAVYPGTAVAIHARHLAELDARLREAADCLMPEYLLAALVDFLQAPETSLSVQPVSVTVDRMGVMAPPRTAEAESADMQAVNQTGMQTDAQTLHFPELAARDQRRYLVMLAKIDRAEAQAAVAAVRDQQRRFMLI